MVERDSAPDEAPASAHAPTTVGEAGAYFAELPVDQVTPNERQPRQVFDQEAMAELVHSIQRSDRCCSGVSEVDLNSSNT